MDNAGNCNTMVEHLSQLIPGFRGASSRTRCFPHTVNLIAKVSVVLYFSIKCSQTDNCHLQAFISFFYRQRSKPRAAEPEKPAKRGGQTKQQPPEELLVNGANDPDLVSVPEPTPEEAEMCAALEGADLER